MNIESLLPELDPGAVQVPMAPLSADAKRLLATASQYVAERQSATTAAHVREVLSGLDVAEDAAVELRNAVIEAEVETETAFYASVGVFIFACNANVELLRMVGGMDWSPRQEKVRSALRSTLASQADILRNLKLMHPCYAQQLDAALLGILAELPECLHESCMVVN